MEKINILRRTSVILGVMFIVAFIAYSFFPWATTRSDLIRFNSPDETVNYVFSVRLAESASLKIREPINSFLNGVARPRATTVVGSSIVPATFLGLPILYGSLGLTLGKWILPYLTPLITALALLAAYAVWRRYASRSTALIATALLAFHPALWYYASRGFYHNALFVDLLFFAWWGYLRFRETNWSLEWLSFTTIVLMGAVFVRSSEILWLAPIILFVLWHERRHWRLSHLAIALTIGGALLSLGLLLSTSVFGAPWASGYQVADLSADSSILGASKALVIAVLLPFGFDLKEIFFNVSNIGLLLFLPYWLLIGVGGFDVFKNRRQGMPATRPIISRGYLALAAWLTVWLIFYYGSWHVVDSVGIESLTIGTSHVRYWLPIYIVWLPFAAQGIQAIGVYFGKMRRIWMFSSILSLCFFGFALVYFDPTEGLTAIAGRLAEYRSVSRVVNARTSERAVIVSDRSDKVFWPERRVISPGDRPFFTYPKVMENLPELIDFVPVYLYAKWTPNADLRLKLKKQRIEIMDPLALPDGGWLYPLVRL